MPLRTKYFALSGGLDRSTPNYLVKPGKLLDVLNYECVEEGGYRRIKGYELFDGSGDPQPVPGSGPIRGVWIYEDEVYAFRDDGGAMQTDMYKATSFGWELQDLGRYIDFTGGTNTEPSEGDTLTGLTSGATATIHRVVIDTGTFGGSDAVGHFTLTNVVGTFQDAEALQVSAVTIATANGADQANILPPSGRYTFVNYNFFGQADTIRMYAVNGVGKAFEWDGTAVTHINTGLSDSLDKPKFIAAHKNHLALGYIGGSVFVSSLGNPLVFNAVTGSIELTVGDEVRSVRSLQGGVLGIGTEDSFWVLYGTTASDFRLERFASSGMRAYSGQYLGGDTIYMDDRGVQLLSQTDAFGDFEFAMLTKLISTEFLGSANAGTNLSSIINKTKNQYRIFFNNTGFYFTFAQANSNTGSVRSLEGITRVLFNDDVLVAAQGEDSNGLEQSFFGSNDGKVFKFESSAFFDGADIPALLRPVFHHYGSPSQHKRWRRLQFDIKDAPNDIRLFVTPEFDYGASRQTHEEKSTDITLLPGGIWDLDDWDEFIWDGEGVGEGFVCIQGIGYTMSLIIFSDGADGSEHTLSGVVVHYLDGRTLRGC